ncbi:MAG: CvpA family protein [Parvularculaceae bacterium]|nr:CvpA family protein [Parvularculaceae bacterium]
MTSFDFLVVFVLALSIGFAVIRGALKEIGTLLALALAVVGAFVFVKPVAAVFLAGKSSFLGTIVAGGVIGAVLFFALYVALHLGLRRVALTARGVQVDRIFGGVFGAIRGIVLIGLGFLAYAYYLDDDRRPEAVAKALTLPLAEAAAGVFERMAPASTRLDERTAPAPEKKSANAARDGYARNDRSALSEMVATVSSSEPAAEERLSPGASPQEQ